MENKEDHHAPLKKFGSRHVQILLMFFAVAICFALRVCMSVAIVAMTNKESANPAFQEYDWDSKTRGMILSSFFWGYVVTHVPSGLIARTHSAQKLLAFGVFVSSVLNMLIPWLANYGYVPVICTRLAMGLFQGCLMPCVQTLLSRWVPPLERGRLGSFVMNGPHFGTVISMPISGALAASSFGWPSIFYIFGIIGIIWSTVFYCMGSDYPSEHPKICSNEVRYINSSLGNMNKVANAEKLKVPWKSIMTSLPMWVLIIAQAGHTWGFFTLLTEMPTYMKSVLDFDVSKSGGISALPYLATWLLSFPFGYLADFALRKGVSVEVVRKVCNSIGLWGPCAALIVLCLVNTTNKVILVAILVVAVALNSGIGCGLQINHIDLSPNFAGPMMAISNCLSNIFGIAAPLVCGIIVDDEKDVTKWHIVFYITAAIYFISNLAFVVFGKANIQSWNYSGGQENGVQASRVSVISITGEPTALSIPEKIQEE